MTEYKVLRNSILWLCSVICVDLFIHIRLIVINSIYPYTKLFAPFIIVASIISCLLMPYLLIEQLRHLYRLQNGMRMSDYFTKRVKLIGILRWSKYLPFIILVALYGFGFGGILGILIALSSILSTVNIMSFLILWDVISLFIYKKLKNKIITSMDIYHTNLGGNNGKA